MEKRRDNFRDVDRTIANGLSAIMRTAIQENADPVYKNSPAKVAAIKSANNWSVKGPLHLLTILSMAYANYKQYGCAGLEIKILVQLTGKNKADGDKLFTEAFINP